MSDRHGTSLHAGDAVLYQPDWSDEEDQPVCATVVEETGAGQYLIRMAQASPAPHTPRAGEVRVLAAITHLMRARG